MNRTTFRIGARSFTTDSPERAHGTLGEIAKTGKFPQKTIVTMIVDKKSHKAHLCAVMARLATLFDPGERDEEVDEFALMAYHGEE